LNHLKVCIFTETYFPIVGGGENQARLLAESLVEQGHSVIILTRRTDPVFKRIEKFGEITVYRIPPAGVGQRKKWGLLLSCVPALFRLRQYYDLLFVSGFRRIGIAAVLVSKILNKRCVLKADSSGEFSGDYFSTGLQKFRLKPSSLLFRPFLWLQRKILKQADTFVAISTDITDELLVHGVNAEQIVPIPNGVDTTRFLQVTLEKKLLLRQKLGIPQNKRILIYTGRLVSYKGLPLLLRVWKNIQRKYSDVRLMLLGSGGLDTHNCEEDLKKYVLDNQLSNSVRFTGDVDNVYEYLQASDIFVFPTENEAFGASLVEAMACGLPVITTPVGAIKDIVTDGETGLLIQPGNAEQLFQALEAILSDKELAANLGQAAYQSVKEFYSTDMVREKYLDLFQGLVTS